MKFCYYTSFPFLNNLKNLDFWACLGRGKPPSYMRRNTVLYFFGYKTDFFFFQNNPKDLDPSCKTDPDLWVCLGRVNFVL